jgi:hypothetical protein
MENKTRNVPIVRGQSSSSVTSNIDLDVYYGKDDTDDVNDGNNRSSISSDSITSSFIASTPLNVVAGCEFFFFLSYFLKFSSPKIIVIFFSENI